MCILSNKSPLLSVPGQAGWRWVTHTLCCDRSEDRVALTTVRCPNKISPKCSAVVFFATPHSFLFLRFQVTNVKHLCLLRPKTKWCHIAVQDRVLNGQWGCCWVCSWSWEFSSNYIPNIGRTLWHKYVKIQSQRQRQVLSESLKPHLFGDFLLLSFWDYCVCVDVLPVCDHALHGCSNNGSQNRWLWVAICVLGIKPRSSTRIDAVNDWAFSPALVLGFGFIWDKILLQTRLFRNLIHSLGVWSPS